ncbi:MAG: signal peptidase I [Bdellovibrionales bacterium]|nr:signal peptidase I [Bdellovibrionales bacterium]
MDGEGNPSQGPWGESLKSILREYAESLIIAMIIAFSLRYFVITTYYVNVQSMLPQYLQGDFIVGYKPPHGFAIPFSSEKWAIGEPIRGEVVIIQCPTDVSQHCLKRIIGIPGDRVEFQKGRLIVNGIPAEYQKIPTKGSQELWKESSLGRSRTVILADSSKEDPAPLIVPPGHVYVLGDHRKASHDSRTWGPVEVAGLEARPLMIWLSVDWEHPDSKDLFPKVRWSRLFSRLD